MAAKTQRIEITLETLLESVDLAEVIVMRIAEAAGFSEEDIHKMGMAVREGVINAYNYGNQQIRDKKIFMTVELEPDKMIVRVLDQGKGFELTEVPDPLAEENLLVERHIRYGTYGGIAYHHVSDTYILLFSHFIACGVCYPESMAVSQLSHFGQECENG